MEKDKDMTQSIDDVSSTLACVRECFQSDIKKEWLPFNDYLTNIYFPVLEGTTYSRMNCVCKKEWIPFLGKLAIEDIWYNKKIEYLLSLPLTKETFNEHSLFLLREHLKTFSPYSEKAKELLKKLETLE